MNLSIRPATVNDASLISDISHQTFYDAFAKDNTKEDMDQFLNEQFTKGKLMLEVFAPENIFLLAFLNKEIAGYLKLRDAKKPEGLGNLNALEIARLYVLKDKIGTGVGKGLMISSIDIAKQKSKQVIWLGVWEKNARAIDFYTKWGFEKFGEQEFLLGNDLQNDWLMKKELN